MEVLEGTPLVLTGEGQSSHIKSAPAKLKHDHSTHGPHEKSLIGINEKNTDEETASRGKQIQNSRKGKVPVEIPIIAISGPQAQTGNKASPSPLKKIRESPNSNKSHLPSPIIDRALGLDRRSPNTNQIDLNMPNPQCKPKQAKLTQQGILKPCSW